MFEIRHFDDKVHYSIDATPGRALGECVGCLLKFSAPPSGFRFKTGVAPENLDALLIKYK
jgi:hypothetical protein